MYRFMGRIHAELAHGFHRLREDDEGQGTIEYVALIALMVTLMAGVTQAAGLDLKETIPKTIANKLKGAIDGIKGGG